VILRRRHIDLILSGRKTTEIRLSRTDMLQNHMTRWRRGRTYYGRHHVMPDDAARFEQLSPWRYGVQFILPHSPP